MASENNGAEKSANSSTVRLDETDLAALLEAKSAYEREVAGLEVTMIKFAGLVVRRGIEALGLRK